MRTNLIKPKNISEAKSKTSNDGMLDMVIADATPHEVGYSYGNRVRNNKIDWRAEAKKAAEKGYRREVGKH